MLKRGSPILNRGDTRIDVVRHGEIVGGQRFCGSTDVPLSAVGWQQLWAAVSDDPGWQAVVTSPLQRCAKFAQAFAEQQQLPWHSDERLRELHFGDWEGRDSAELWQHDREALSRFWANPAERPPPNGESLAEFSRRVEAAWHDLRSRYSGQRVLVVSHSGVIRLLLCRQHGLPLSRLLEIEIKHGQRIALDCRR